jgi:hypothetical protein
MFLLPVARLPSTQSGRCAALWPEPALAVQPQQHLAAIEPCNEQYGFSLTDTLIDENRSPQKRVRRIAANLEGKAWTASLCKRLHWIVS